MNDLCVRAEILAGAIALGEAVPAERDEYRLHIATCPECLRALGGEREIERVMARIADARATETWEPLPRLRTARGSWRWFAAGATAAAAVAAMLIVGFRGGVREPAAMLRTAAAPVRHVTVAHVPAPRPIVRRTSPPIARPAAPARLLAVAAPPPRPAARIPRRDDAVTVPAVKPAPLIANADVPVWRRAEPMPSPQVARVPQVARAPQAAQVAQAPAQVSAVPALSGNAESMSVSQPPSVREAFPLGAIKPHPVYIPDEADAHGTAAFEVQVNEHGVPSKCTITRSSGYLVLDVAVCRAAMGARYAPRMVNGKATVGTYRDAFTFRQVTDEDDSDENPHF